MAEIRLVTAFGTVPLDAQDGIRRVLEDSIAELAREEGTFRQARAVFTEANEQCVLTVELDGTRREPNPLRLDLAQVEGAVTDSGAQALVKETMRGYFRRVLGR
jgi:hypothetical protein